MDIFQAFKFCAPKFFAKIPKKKKNLAKIIHILYIISLMCAKR